MNISPSLSHFIVLNFYVSLWLSLSFIPLTGTSWQPAVLLHQYRLLGKGEIGNLDRCSGWQDSPLTPVVSMVKHLSGMTSLYSIYFFFLSLYLSINHPPRYSAGSCCVMLGQKLACAGIHFLLAHFQPKAPFSCITIFASNKQLSTLGEHHLLITVSSCFSFFLTWFWWFQRFRHIGATVTTSEAVLLQLVGDKDHPKFKEIQAIIKISAPESGLVSSLWCSMFSGI